MLLRTAIAAVVALTLAATTVSANYTANFFMDQVLNEMHLQVPQTGLDPLRVVPFQIKVKSNGLTNRDLKANFTQGSLTGLSRLVRQGDCSYGSYGLGWKMGCYILLAPVQILLNGDVKGDSILGKKHAIGTSTFVSPNSLALTEIQGVRGGPANFDRISMRLITMTTSVTQGKLDLNKSRTNDFVKQVHDQLAMQLGTTLSNTYASALAAVVSRRVMP